MANTTKIISNDIVRINNTYTDTPVDAGLSGVCLITKGNDNKLFTYYSDNDVENDFGADEYVTNFAHNYFNAGNSPMFQVITYNGKDEQGSAVELLRKYYECGSEYFAFLVSGDDDKQTAIDLANLVENQSHGLMFIDIPTKDVASADFSAFQPLKNNKSTILLSAIVQDNNVAHYQFISQVLGVRANEAPNASLQNVHNLPDVTPQDKFEFNNGDLMKYSSNGVITYAYRNNIAMLTGGNSPSGYQISNIITRDWLNYKIKQAVTNVIVNNDIAYTNTGINIITDQIKNILNSAVDNQYIESFRVSVPNAAQITEAKKESGTLDGLGFTWTPTNNITNAVFQENIQLPQL